MDELGNVVRNKARLVVQGYNQDEGLISMKLVLLQLETIKMLLAFACHMDFKLFQIDVKSAFLNGFV